MLANSGLPEGCILSIRSGTIRRQAPLASGKAFKFPDPLSNPLKFDLLMPVASGHLVTRPGQEQYKVDFGEGGAMNCELQVKPSQPSATVNTKTADEPKKDSSIAGAKEFLEQHAILEFVQAVLHTIITEKPKDPYMEMARHFMCGYTAIDRRSDKAPPPDAPKAADPQRPPAAAADVPKDAAQAAEVPSDSPEEAPPADVPKPADPQRPPAATAEVLEDTAKAAEAPVEAAGASEPPKAALEQAPVVNDEELRVEMKDKLLTACDTGELQTVLETVAASGSAQSVVAGAKDDELRTQMRTCLLEACDSGKLSAALESVMPPVVRDPVPADEQPPSPTTLVDDQIHQFIGF